MTTEVEVALNKGAQDGFVRSEAAFPAFMGGQGCVAAETLVSGMPVADRERGDVRTLLGSSPATASFLKGRADLYRVVTKSGREVVVTLGHRFLTPSGWRQLSDLSAGDCVAADGSGHGLLDSQIGRGCRDCYSSGSRPSDGLSFLGAAGILNRLPLPRMIVADSSASWAENPPSRKSSCSPLALRHSASLHLSISSGGECAHRQRRSLSQSLGRSRPLDNGTRSRPSVDRILSRGRHPRVHLENGVFLRSSLDSSPASRLPDAAFQVPDTALTPEHNRAAAEIVSSAIQDPFPFPCVHYSTFWDSIVRVTFDRYGDYYDLTVPHLHHYSANGLWHHNSGKTAGGVIKCWMYTIENPGSRGVWTEPVAAMFAESCLPTLRGFFGEYEGSFWTEQGKGGPNHRIEFANGCLWMLKAAETPERLVGFEVAWALMNEAGSTEHGSQEQAYLNLVGRLRQKGFRHWLGVATTPSGRNWLWREWVDNPTAKETGHVLFPGSTFENKANLPDGYIERMTQTYIEGTPMYRQYVLGEFVQMEGLVLPNFDPDKHIAPWPDELFIRKIAGVDFGVQSATAIVECAVTKTGHRYLREWLYKRDCNDETFVKACRDAMDDGITLFVCDPSGKDRIRWMQEKGIPAIKARSNRIELRVKSWITPLSQGMLTICNESQFLIREASGLSWAKRRGRELETDKFDVNTPDHAWDAAADALQEIEAMPIGFKPPKLVEHGVLA